MPKEVLRERVFRGRSDVFQSIAAELERRGLVTQDRDVIRMAGHDSELSPEEKKAVEKLRAIYAKAGLEVPKSESLKDTIHRVLPCYEAEIAPALRAGERVLVSAHGNSLRALEKHLSNIGDDDIVKLEIPTGEPIVYELGDDLAVRDRYYLAERTA
jgi:bisphosphoglycerate-dependent phosphoglycerate mutase family 1